MSKRKALVAGAACLGWLALARFGLWWVGWRIDQVDWSDRGDEVFA